MSLQQRLVQRWRSIGLMLLLAAGMAGTTLAGIQGTGFRSLSIAGTVDTSDGLHVNGVPIDASKARVLVNGQPADVSQLQTGHIVTAHGSVSPDGSLAIADEIELESDVRGAITAVDRAHASFNVLGQTIQLTAESVLDGRIQPNDLSGLRPGTWVKVSAFQRADGLFQASRVDLDVAPTQLQVRGVVESLDSDRRQLRVGDLTIDYSTAAIHGTIAPGGVVLARGVQVQPDGPLVASRIDVFTGVGQPGDRGDVEGLVTAMASAADFQVDGQAVLADAKTVYVLHGQSLATDLEVQVTGHFDATGALIADRIQAADAPARRR
jgi:Domain of unknown function (DUF5666)